MSSHNKQGETNPGRPEDNDYLFVEGVVFDVGYGIDPMIRDIKEVAGEAISVVPGVLALQGGNDEILRKDEDLARGVAVNLADGGLIDVGVRVIAEAGYDGDRLVRQTRDLIAEELQTQLELTVNQVAIDIIDTMTATEFYNLYDADHTLH